MAGTSPIAEPGPEEARRRFGAELRALRKNAGLTGDQLAERLGWSQAKVSKTETGKTLPALSDVRAFAEATGATGAETRALLTTFEELATQVAGWRTLLRAGIVGSQGTVAEREQAMTVNRHLGVGVVPGLLQTAEYARCVLTGGPDPTADVPAGVSARLRRQEVLYAAGKRFHYVVMEDALRRFVAEPLVMAVQMDRIGQLSTLASLDIAVLPRDRRLPVPPLHGFHLYDDELVTIELETGMVQTRDSADVAYYRRLFDTLHDVAEHGNEVRTRLHDLAEHYRALASAG